MRGLPSTSRTFQAIHGERWGRTDLLLAGAVDRLAVANWQRAGNKRQARPQPLPRPGVEKGKRFGTKSMSIDEWRTRHGEGGEHGSRARHGLHQPRPVS